VLSRLRLTIIVVFHAMARQAPRALFTLSAAYQHQAVVDEQFLCNSLP